MDVNSEYILLSEVSSVREEADETRESAMVAYWTNAPALILKDCRYELNRREEREQQRKQEVSD
jgi:hypothetical protein